MTELRSIRRMLKDTERELELVRNELMKTQGELLNWRFRAMRAEALMKSHLDTLDEMRGVCREADEGGNE